MFINKKLTFTALLIILINIALFTYFVLQTNKPNINQAKIIPNIKPLVLLSESNQMVKEQPPKINTNNKTKEPPAPVIEPTTKPKQSNIAVVSKPQTKANNQQISSTETQPILENETNLITTKVEPTIVTPTIPKAPAPAPVIDNVLCYTIGPFEKKADKIHTQNQLNALSIQSKERIILEKEISSYYLYIPPHKTLKAALLTIDKLKKKKVRDFYLLRTGDRTNAIALGLFSQEKHALRKFDLLKKLYFKVKMEVRYIDKEVFWLDYQGKESVLSQIDLQQLSPLPLQLYLRQCKN